MARSFEELEVWQRARELVGFIYRLTNNNNFKKDFGLVDQIRRASISIMSNIAEGFERGSNMEFVQFLYIAKGSAGEVRTQLYIARDLDYIDDDKFKQGVMLSKDVSAQTSRLIQYLKGSRYRGEKFKKKYKSMREEVEELLQEFTKKKE